MSWVDSGLNLRTHPESKTWRKGKTFTCVLPSPGGMNKRGRVSSKGQVVIPAELRRKLKITRTVLIREDGGKIVMEPWVSMEEAFGSGGKEMIDAAIEISRDSRREVESERP